MMAKLSASRGFAAELSTALVILVASQLGLPTSSSQAITGGIIGVGLLEGITTGVNWKFFAKQVGHWGLMGAALGVWPGAGKHDATFAVPAPDVHLLLQSPLCACICWFTVKEVASSSIACMMSQLTAS
jgi:hypothetical protein